MADQQPQADLPAHQATAHASWAGDFSSWGALKGASTLIIVGTAGVQRTTLEYHDLPWTATNVLIDSVLHGDIAPGQSLDVRQFGGKMADGTDVEIDDFRLLTPGNRYLLFLTPAVVVPNQFYPVGGLRGVFTVGSDGLVDSYSSAAAGIGVAVRGTSLDRLAGTVQATQALDVRP